jgi:hypothetical protein
MPDVRLVRFATGTVAHGVILKESTLMGSTSYADVF